MWHLGSVVYLLFDGGQNATLFEQVNFQRASRNFFLLATKIEERALLFRLFAASIQFRYDRAGIRLGAFFDSGRTEGTL